MAGTDQAPGAAGRTILAQAAEVMTATEATTDVVQAVRDLPAIDKTQDSNVAAPLPPVDDQNPPITINATTTEDQDDVHPLLTVGDPRLAIDRAVHQTQEMGVSDHALSRTVGDRATTQGGHDTVDLHRASEDDTPPPEAVLQIVVAAHHQRRQARATRDRAAEVVAIAGVKAAVAAEATAAVAVAVKIVAAGAAAAAVAETEVEVGAGAGAGALRALIAGVDLEADRAIHIRKLNDGGIRLQRPPRRNKLRSC